MNAEQLRNLAILEAEKAERGAAEASAVAAAEAPLLARIAKLERQVASLRAMFSDLDSPLSKTIKVIVDSVVKLQKSALRYRGVWGGVATSPAYSVSDCVTMSGGLWICHRNNPGRPGDADSGWALAVKQGAVT